MQARGNAAARRRWGRQNAVLRALLAVSVALTVAVCAVARPQARALLADESAALAATVNQFNSAMSDGRLADVIGTIPPRVLDVVARKAGIGADDIRKSMIEQIKQSQNDIKIVAFGMDLPAAKHGALASGTPYVLIPTRTVMEAGSVGRVKASSETLALLDEGKWYLLRIEGDASIALLRETYPEFAAVQFAKGTMEIEKK